MSAREFESGIEKSLIEIQNKSDTTIAVYPVIPRPPNGVSGYDLFAGGIKNADLDRAAREVGRRRKYGSEDRVGHLISKLQDKYKRNNGTSAIECIPTINQLKSQKIQHIVFIDDISGSGKRIAEFWKYCVPRSIKSLLSFKRIELWIVVYAITSKGRSKLQQAIPNFPLTTHLVSVLPESDYRYILDHELIDLANNYSKTIGMNSSALGYKGSGGLIVFEHGCPNNVPAIFWANTRNWKGVFPNGSIPTDLRPYFDDSGAIRSLESLWRSNQRKLALSLLEQIEQKKVTTDVSLMLVLLGLLLRGVKKSTIPRHLLLANDKYDQLIELAAQHCLYTKNNEQVTALGKLFIQRYRDKYGYSKKKQNVENDPVEYYPTQCEGNVRFSGKVTRGNGRVEPMETL